MTYMNMARKYRPETFADVAAQSHITETLRRALQTDRVAAAYLFTGPRGSGKTTVARLLAKAVNCNAPKKGEPCTKCDTCEAIKKGRSMDVLEIDGASNNSVDDIRELRENVRYAATEAGKRKVYIIDEVHMLSIGAFNALLKTLEEPPPHVMFVFATTEVRKVPATILSRCQRFDFRRLTTQEIHERLKHVARQEKKNPDSKLDVSSEALFVLSKRADGSLRDALSLLDQVQSSSQGRIDEDKVAEILGLVREDVYLGLSEAIAARDAVQTLHILHDALRQGADPGVFVLGLLEHLRNLLMLSVDDELQATVQLGDAHMKRAQELAASFETEDLLFLLNRTAAVHEEVRRSSNPVVLLESSMVELASFESRVLLKQVLERLEEGGGGGGAQASAPGSGAARGSRRGSARGASHRRTAGAEATTPGTAPGTTAGSRHLGASRSQDVVAGGPPTFPGSASGAGPAASVSTQTHRMLQGERKVSIAAAASATGLGEPQIVSRASQTASAQPDSAAPPLAESSLDLEGSPGVQDFDSHLDGAFEETSSRSDLDIHSASERDGAPEQDSAPEQDRAPEAVKRFPGGTLNLQTLNAHWSDFTEVVRGSKAMLAHCLSEGQPRSLENGVLAIGFSEEQAFHLNLMREARTQRELETQLETFFGKRLKVDLSDNLQGAQKASVPSPAVDRSSARLTPEDVAQSRRDAAEDALQQTPRLQEILDTFDGEILEDNQT